MKNSFDILLILARPAAGKSEVIDYLNRTPIPERINRFHIGNFNQIDDFPMLWTWFEEDEILEKLGHPRLYTDLNGYFRDHFLWDLLIERISLEYTKSLRDINPLEKEFTTIVEFSRGKEHGGYQRAFLHLSEEILMKAAILYIDVPWEESLRKNRKRYNPDRPDSILEHGLSDVKLEKLYKYIDWDDVSSPDSEFITIKGIKVPYVVMNNSDDVTSQGGSILAERLEAQLNDLWKLYQKSNK